MELIDIAAALCMSMIGSGDAPLWDGETLTGEGAHFECIAENMADPDIFDREGEAEAILQAVRDEAMAAQLGFINLHTDNEQNGGGDGKWYPIGGERTQHVGDFVMSRGAAQSAGIEIGE